MPDLDVAQPLADANPRISVVIAHYNYGEYVGDAIESVLAQSRPAHEIIVVDDGSTDNSAQVLDRYKDLITLYRQDNAGVSSARNTGIRHASGEWIALLDSDDMWEPDLLATYARATRDYPQAGMIAMGRRIISADGKKPTTSRHHLPQLRNSPPGVCCRETRAR